MDLTNFYLVSATAAATLLGLLFIAVQFNLETFASEPNNRWRALARSTFVTFVVLFILPLMLLVPKLDSHFRGAIILAISITNLVRTLLIWVPLGRGVFQGRVERLWQIGWLQIGPLIVYLSLGWLGLALIHDQDSDSIELGIAFTLVGLFTLALRNSWNLLVEVVYERKRKGQ